MITTVTLNPAFDKIVEISNLKIGEVHRIEKQVVSLGGKSINVARILEGLDMKTNALCFAGEDNLEQVKKYASKENLHLETIVVEGETRTNVKVVEPDHGYRTTDINEQGFLVKGDKLESMSQALGKAASISDFVVLSGSLPRGVGKDYYKEMILANRGRTKIVLDADGEFLELGNEAGPYLIKPNIHELEAAYDCKLNSHEETIRLCRRLIQGYGITYIAVSLGALGSILVSRTEAMYAEAMDVKVVSTVGAGDSMLAGILFGLIQHDQDQEVEKLTKALAYGVASSSIAISTQEHKKITSEQLKETAKKVTIIHYEL